MHIVRAPAPPGQGGDPPTRRRKQKARQRSLTDGEAMRLAAALRHLRALYGGLDVLASVMGMSVNAIANVIAGREHPGPGMARRAAKAAGKSLDGLIGGIASADVCPHCGRGAP